MFTECDDCGHPLFCQVRDVAGIPALMHFDAARFGAYATHVPRCPDCGRELDRDLPHDARASSRPARRSPVRS